MMGRRSLADAIWIDDDIFVLRAVARKGAQPVHITDAREALRELVQDTKRNPEVSALFVQEQLDVFLELVREHQYLDAVTLAYDVAVSIDEAEVAGLDLPSEERLYTPAARATLIQLLECIPDRHRRKDVERDLIKNGGSYWHPSETGHYGLLEVSRAELREIKGCTDAKATQILRLIYGVDPPGDDWSRHLPTLRAIAGQLDAIGGVQSLVLDSGIALGDYVNMGDPYVSTFMWLNQYGAEAVRKSAEAGWYVGAWGDVREAFENQHPPFERAGTVSSGTLRAEDLIGSFADELEAISGHVGDNQYADLIEEARQDFDTIEDPDELINVLADALNERAPEGYYFGAHPGDGADFGWWPVEED